MKRLFKCLMCMAMALAIVGCGGEKKTSIDLSTYPEKFESWTTKDVMNYFKDKGVIEGKKVEEYVQVENDSINPTPKEMTELGSFMDDEGTVMIFVYYFDPQTKSDAVKNAFEATKTSKQVNIEDSGTQIPLPTTYMVGQFAIGDQSIDMEVSKKLETAINDLCKDMSVEKTF